MLSRADNGGPVRRSAGGSSAATRREDKAKKEWDVLTERWWRNWNIPTEWKQRSWGHEDWEENEFRETIVNIKIGNLSLWKMSPLTIERQEEEILVTKRYKYSEIKQNKHTWYWWWHHVKSYLGTPGGTRAGREGIMGGALKGSWWLLKAWLVGPGREGIGGAPKAGEGLSGAPKAGEGFMGGPGVGPPRTAGGRLGAGAVEGAGLRWGVGLREEHDKYSKMKWMSD